MKRFMAIAMLTVGALSSGGATAWINDGHELAKHQLEFKRAEVDVEGANYTSALMFQAYVVATFDALYFRGVVCAAPETTVRQIGRVVSNHLDAHPERWGEVAYVLMRDALTVAFPCETSRD